MKQTFTTLSLYVHCQTVTIICFVAYLKCRDPTCGKLRHFKRIFILLIFAFTFPPWSIANLIQLLNSTNTVLQLLWQLSLDLKVFSNFQLKSSHFHSTCLKINPHFIKQKILNICLRLNYIRDNKDLFIH